MRSASRPQHGRAKKNYDNLGTCTGASDGVSDGHGQTFLDYDTYSITMTGAELSQARERLGLTQAQLSDALGMWRNSVARMERSELPVMKHTELAVKYLLLTMEKKSQRRKTHGRKTRTKND